MFRRGGIWTTLFDGRAGRLVAALTWCICVLGLLGPPTATADEPASATDTATGVIHGVNSRTRTIKLRTGSGLFGTTLHVRSSPTTRITLNGNPAAWDLLEEGRPVEVRWSSPIGRQTHRPRRVYATEIVIPTETLTGRIDGVNTAAGTVRATIAELESVAETTDGKTVTSTRLKETDSKALPRRERFALWPQARLTRDGAEVPLDRLARGETFRAVVVPGGAKMLLVDLELNPQVAAAGGQAESEADDAAAKD
jgi:hypothetical protein